MIVRRASAVITAPWGALAAFLLARCPDTRGSGLQDAAPNLVDELVRVDELDAHLVERPLRVGPVLRHSVSGVEARVTGATAFGKNPRGGGGVTLCCGAAVPRGLG